MPLFFFLPNPIYPANPNVSFFFNKKKWTFRAYPFKYQSNNGNFRRGHFDEFSEKSGQQKFIRFVKLQIHKVKAEGKCLNQDYLD